MCTHLKVFGGLLVARHEHELGANAAEMHVTQKGGTLHCRVICGLWKDSVSCSITVHSRERNYYKERIMMERTRNRKCTDQYNQLM